MRLLAAGLVALCVWAGCGEETYERREGPRLSPAERDGRFRYEDLLGLNVCNENRDGADLRRQARRQTRALARLVRKKPNALIAVEVVSSDEVLPPRDLTLREYAAESERALHWRPRRHEPRRVRRCVERYSRMFKRLARP